MKLAMHVDLANAVLAYLGKRPHDEVRGLIDAMQGMQEVNEVSVSDPPENSLVSKEAK